MTLRDDNFDLKIVSLKTDNANLEFRISELEKDKAEKANTSRGFGKDIGIWALKGTIVFILGLILLWAKAGFPKISASKYDTFRPR